jgi:hypothetical protein
MVVSKLSNRMHDILYVGDRLRSSTLPSRGSSARDPSIITLDGFETTDSPLRLGQDGDGRAHLRRSTRRLKERIDLQ